MCQLWGHWKHGSINAWKLPEYIGGKCRFKLIKYCNYRNVHRLALNNNYNDIWPCVQFNCSSNMEQFTNGSAVFRVTGHFSTPPENWTVRAFLQLTVKRLYCCVTHFHFPAAFCCGCNLEVYRLMAWNVFKDLRCLSFVCYNTNFTSTYSNCMKYENLRIR